MNATQSNVAKTEDQSLVESKAVMADAFINGLTRTELRLLAGAIGAKIGKSRKDTLCNLHKAIAENQVSIQISCAIKDKPLANGFAPTIFTKHLL